MYCTCGSECWYSQINLILIKPSHSNALDGVYLDIEHSKKGLSVENSWFSQRNYQGFSGTTSSNSLKSLLLDLTPTRRYIVAPVLGASVVDTREFTSSGEGGVSGISSIFLRAFIHRGWCAWGWIGAEGFISAYVCSLAIRKKWRGDRPPVERNLLKTDISWNSSSLVPRATYGFNCQNEGVF